jgi:hypothetical protein
MRSNGQGVKSLHYLSSHTHPLISTSYSLSLEFTYKTKIKENSSPFPYPSHFQVSSSNLQHSKCSTKCADCSTEAESLSSGTRRSHVRALRVRYRRGSARGTIDTCVSSSVRVASWINRCGWVDRRRLHRHNSECHCAARDDWSGGTGVGWRLRGGNGSTGWDGQGCAYGLAAGIRPGLGGRVHWDGCFVGWGRGQDLGLRVCDGG